MTDTTMTNKDKPVDWTKPVQFRNGQKCTVLTMDSKNENYPVVALCPAGIPRTVTKNGAAWLDDYVNDNWDIVSASTIEEKFVNIYDNHPGYFHESLKTAKDQCAGEHHFLKGVIKLIFTDGILTKAEVIEATN